MLTLVGREARSPAPGVAQSAAPTAGPGPVHGNVSVGGLGWQQGEAHLLRGDENTRELHHAGVRPLLVGSNTSLNITLHTHS